MIDPDKAPKLIVGLGAEAETEEPEVSDLEAIAGELIDAVQAGDAAGVVDSLRAAFQALDAEPHEEGEHLGEEMAEEDE